MIVLSFSVHFFYFTSRFSWRTKRDSVISGASKYLALYTIGYIDADTEMENVSNFDFVSEYWYIINYFVKPGDVLFKTICVSEFQAI